MKKAVKAGLLAMLGFLIPTLLLMLIGIPNTLAIVSVLVFYVVYTVTRY